MTPKRQHWWKKLSHVDWGLWLTQECGWYGYHKLCSRPPYLVKFLALRHCPVPCWSCGLIVPSQHSLGCPFLFLMQPWWLMGTDRLGSRVSTHSLLMLYSLSELMKFYDRRATTSFLVIFIFLASGSERWVIFHLCLKMPRWVSAICLLRKLANCINART